MKKKNTEARIYLDVDPEVVFIFNGLFWTVTKLKDVKNVKVSTAIVVTREKKHVYYNTTIGEALEKSNSA